MTTPGRGRGRGRRLSISKEFWPSNWPRRFSATATSPKIFSSQLFFLHFLRFSLSNLIRRNRSCEKEFVNIDIKFLGGFLHFLYDLGRSYVVVNKIRKRKSNFFWIFVFVFRTVSIVVYDVNEISCSVSFLNFSIVVESILQNSNLQSHLHFNFFGIILD